MPFDKSRGMTHAKEIFAGYELYSCKIVRTLLVITQQDPESRVKSQQEDNCRFLKGLFRRSDIDPRAYKYKILKSPPVVSQ